MMCALAGLPLVAHGVAQELYAAGLFRETDVQSCLTARREVIGGDVAAIREITMVLARIDEKTRAVYPGF
jgi:hypothetical protein